VKIKDSIFEKIERTKNLPSLPQVLLKLMEACSNEDTPLDELSRFASKDPSLASKILRLVNSSFSGLLDPITSLDKAILYLGADTLKNLAISASVLQTFSRAAQADSGGMRKFWWHSLLCATLARRIAKQAGYSNPEEAYLSGILHDIGKLILWRCYPEEGGRLLQRSGIHGGKDGEGINAVHAEVGAWMIRRWHLDSFMSDAVAYHHEPLDAVLEAFPVVKIVYVANLLSYGDAGTSGSTGPEAAKTVFGFSEPQVDSILSGARKEVLEVAEAMNIPVEMPSEEVSGKRSGSEDELLTEIKNFSLLYGTLENLLKSDTREAILLVLERGLRILFDVMRIFFFLYDPEKKILAGTVSEPRSSPLRLRDLSISTAAKGCLPAAALIEGSILESCNRSDLSIADKQLIALLGTEDLCCVPLIAYRQWVGVIVLGVSGEQSQRLSSRNRLLRMFADHAAVCLFINDFKKRQEKKIQAERIESASLLARKVVHEVNNPLGVIKNYLKILGLKLPEGHPALEDLDIIAKEIDRTFQIVRQLYRFSQPESSQSQAVDVNRLITAHFNLLRKSILSPAGIKDHLSLQKDLPPAAADENGLKQVFLNLVKNSAEAMPKGGNLYIRTRFMEGMQSELEKGVEAVSGFIEITLKDDGPGIPDEIRSRLFEPFISSKGDAHHGLGLSIVHNIVKETGGSIACESHAHTGTVFVIALPVVKSTEKQRQDACCFLKL
jgi:putative nucleotidyltransferase with HDIG domain